MVGAVKRATKQTKTKTRKKKKTNLSNKQLNSNSVKETKKPIISDTFKFLLTCLFNIILVVTTIQLVKDCVLVSETEGQAETIIYFALGSERRGTQVKNSSKEKADTSHPQDQVNRKNPRVRPGNNLPSIQIENLASLHYPRLLLDPGTKAGY